MIIIRSTTTRKFEPEGRHRDVNNNKRNITPQQRWNLLRMWKTSDKNNREKVDKNKLMRYFGDNDGHVITPCAVALRRICQTVVAELKREKKVRKGLEGKLTASATSLQDLPSLSRVRTKSTTSCDSSEFQMPSQATTRNSSFSCKSSILTSGKALEEKRG